MNSDKVFKLKATIEVDNTLNLGNSGFDRHLFMG